jgi:NTP pyrophosphatase (non-canonical NTP hydrolase)
MKPSFNRLTPKEAELLALLAEECGKVVQAVTKILRHGPNSTHPASDIKNVANLERELGDVCAAMTMMADSFLVQRRSIEVHADEKLKRVQQYLHHWNDPK